MNTAELKKHYSVRGGKITPYTIERPVDCDNWKRPAVIVVAGGAYSHVSKREGAPVACKFLAEGFQAFVFEYLISADGVRYPEQLHELACAVDYVKRRAGEYGVNRDEIFIVGFSAGGHLTADLAVEYGDILSLTGERLNCKPTAVALCYPVISAEYGHKYSFDNLLFGYSDEEKNHLLQKLNLDGWVTKATVPAFIWATAGDETVPAENSLQFALALARNGVRYELHIYPDGGHGSSTCDFELNADAVKRNAQWIENCISFFRSFTSEKY